MENRILEIGKVYYFNSTRMSFGTFKGSFGGSLIFANCTNGGGFFEEEKGVIGFSVRRTNPDIFIEKIDHSNGLEAQINRLSFNAQDINRQIEEAVAIENYELAHELQKLLIN